MSYQNYVIAAYMVFAIVLLWDWVAPRIALKQQLRAVRLRAARAAGHRSNDNGFPVTGSPAMGNPPTRDEHPNP